MTIPVYIAGAELPDLNIAWTENGDLIDFSSGWTFAVKVGAVGSTAVVTKTSGITGADTAPNVTIEWAAGELDDLTAAIHTVQVTATRTADSKQLAKQFQLKISDAIS